MLRDFALAVDPLTGEVDFVYDEVAKDFVFTDDCRNNLILSVMIAKGTYWAAPDFGSTHREVKKNTENAPNEIATGIKEATRWIVASGRCLDIEVNAEADENEPGRINIEVIGRQADGRDVPFTTFLRVI